MQHNLFPPSHFEKDFFNPSSQSIPNNNVSSKKSKSIQTNSALKTPNDFSIPKQTVQHQLLNPQVQSDPILDTSKNKILTSGDSGYDWEHSKVHFPLAGKPEAYEDLLRLFNALRQENENLQTIIEKKAIEKDSNCNYNVITHQVRYIEHLQQDLANSATKLNNSINQLSKLDLQLQEKNFQLKQKDLKLNEMAEELHVEKANVSKTYDTITSLKSSLATSNQEQERLKQEHEIQITVLKKKYQDQLETTIEQSREQQKQMRTYFETERIAWKEKTCEDIEEWKSKLHALTLEYEQNFNNLKKENESVVNDCEARKKELDKELADSHRSQEELNDTILSLQQQLEASKKHAEAVEAEAKTLTDQIHNERESNSQLRAYIARVQSEDHAREKWKTEKEDVESKINALQQQKVEVEKALEMMNVRFQSVSKILEMQEESLAAHTTAIPDEHRQNKAGVVTSQWRSKVFELMVHCKTQEIVAREQGSKHKLVVKGLEDKLHEQRRSSDILTSRANDLEAQLNFQLHLNQTLEENKEKLMEELGSWKEKCNRQKEAVEKLGNVVKTVSETYNQSYEAGMTVCLEKCLRMEQRLSFANNRVRAIQDLLKRRDSMWRVRLQQASQDPVAEATSTQQAKENPDLQMEILHLMEERDSLSHQLAHDAAQFETTIKSMKSIEDDYKQTIQNLEKQIISNEENIEELTCKIKELETKLDDEKYDKDCLATELNETKLSIKQDIEAALEKAKQQHFQEVKQHESALNQVKKDLTKAVVSLRQAERSSVREKNQLTEQLETEKRLCSEQEEMLKNTIRNLEKDNYILMTTIRQEGLLSAVKTARAAPIAELKEVETSPKRVHFENASPDVAGKPKAKTAEMDKMLQDLTNLSEMVLAHSDSD